MATMAEQIKTPNQQERQKNRWMMVLYDSIMYVLCCVFGLVLRLSTPEVLPWQVILFYAVAGYLLFFGFRFVFRCYKQIWRYGAMRAFARELTAGILAAAVLLALGAVLNKVVLVMPIPFVRLVSMVAAYIIISMSFRVFYCYLYIYARSDRLMSATVRFLLEKFAFVDVFSQSPDPVVPLTQEKGTTLALPINEIKYIAEQFAIHGHVTSITQINKGYINQTYRIQTLSDAGHVHKYTLQRINTNVFPDVEALMENFKLTTEHLHQSLSLPGHHKRGSVQTIRTTLEGNVYLRKASGCWRMMPYFDGVYSLDIPDKPETFYQAGVAFGTFLKKMSDVDVSKVHVVIPNFHNTKTRYQDLEVAIKQDSTGRVKHVAKEIAFVRARADKYGIISDALDKGEIPTRVCHNDTNLNNILFDKETRLPVAIIDLDTVMPSSPLYDFGDSMRIGTNTAKDDEKDLSKVSCNLELYAQYARGYLTACGDVLTRRELELLPYAALIITSEDGIRFLMDYIQGDIYYNIYYPDQNLDRARTQLKLVEDMEAKLEKIKQIHRDIYAQLGLQVQIN